MKLFRTIFTNQNGFSLMEMMVAVGLVGAISLGAMSLIRDGYKAQSLSMVKVELEEIIATSKILLSSKLACNSTLAGMNPFTNTAISIVNQGGVNVFSAGQFYSNRRIQITSINVTNFREKVGELTDGGGTGITNREGYVTIVFNFDVSAYGEDLGNKWNRREIEAFVRLTKDSDLIEGCDTGSDQAVISANRDFCAKDIGDAGDPAIYNDLNPATGMCEMRRAKALLSNTAAQKLCAEIGGFWTPNAVTGETDISDGFVYPTRGKCEILEKGYSCPVGQKLKGFAIDGTPVCGP